MIKPESHFSQSIQDLFWRRLSICFLIALVFIIPVEHKYDKPLRSISLALIPQGLELPKFFEKKIYFYPSDLIVWILLFAALFSYKISIRRFFYSKGSICLWIVFLASVLSIFFSPLHHYAIPYIRLWQLSTPLLLFSFLANAAGIEDSSNHNRKRLGYGVLGAMIASSLLQSLIAIAQYTYQKPIGLRLLGEACHFSSGFYVPGGARWIFDELFSRSSASEFVIRAAGTLPHPNVLGGLLCLSTIASYSFFLLWPKARWQLAAAAFLLFFSMCLTYSRSAFFSWLLSTIVWFSYHFIHQGIRAALADSRVRFLGYSLCGTLLLSFSILHTPLIYRGGIFNYNSLAQGADAGRIQYQNLASRMITDHPWVGAGFQQFPLRARDYLPPEEKQQDASGRWVHNIYLYLAAETGLFSLAAFLFFIAYLLYSAMKAPFSSDLGSLIAMFVAILLIGCCDFYPIFSQQGRLLFFLTAGLLAAHSIPSQPIGERHDFSFSKRQLENVRSNFSKL